jgi:uncharacterized small protein (DUF1192 family)
LEVVAMTTAAAAPRRELTSVPPWVTATLGRDVPLEDVIHELSEAIEDDVLGDREVQEVDARIGAMLDRVETLDAKLAGELGGQIDLDHYCAIVRATLRAVLVRQRGTA